MAVVASMKMFGDKSGMPHAVGFVLAVLLTQSELDKVPVAPGKPCDVVIARAKAHGSPGHSPARSHRSLCRQTRELACGMQLLSCKVSHCMKRGTTSQSSKDHPLFDSPHKFVADVGFGHVESYQGVRDVLHAEEHAERKAIVEVAQGYEATAASKRMRLQKAGV